MFSGDILMFSGDILMSSLDNYMLRLDILMLDVSRPSSQLRAVPHRRCCPPSQYAFDTDPVTNDALYVTATVPMRCPRLSEEYRGGDLNSAAGQASPPGKIGARTRSLSPGLGRACPKKGSADEIERSTYCCCVTSTLYAPQPTSFASPPLPHRSLAHIAMRR